MTPDRPRHCWARGRRHQWVHGPLLPGHLTHWTHCCVCRRLKVFARPTFPDAARVRERLAGREPERHA
jgi:hypothetical protein